MTKNKKSLYLDHAAKGNATPCLEEEEWLSRIKRKKFKMPAPLSCEEEQQLAIKIQQGDEQAFIELYTKNIPLAQHISEDYHSPVYDNEEISAEARMGLLHACKKFLPNKKCRLGAYASYWIKQKIKRYIATKARLVNTSCYTYPELCKFIDSKAKLENELGRESSCRELEAATGLSNLKVFQFLNVCNHNNASLNKENNSNKSEEFNVLEEMIPSEELSPPEQICEDERLDEAREAMFERFKDEPRTLEILKRRMGFVNNKVDTLEEIAEDMNLSRERIRQIEGDALPKLRKFIALKNTAKVAKEEIQKFLQPKVVEKPKGFANLKRLAQQAKLISKE